MISTDVFDPARNALNLASLRSLAVAERPRHPQRIRWCAWHQTPAAPTISPVLAGAFSELAATPAAPTPVSGGRTLQFLSVPASHPAPAIFGSLPQGRPDLSNLGRLTIPEPPRAKCRITAVEGSISPIRQQENLTERGALEPILPFVCQRFLSASTLKALLGMPTGTLLRRIGERFEIVADREAIDLDDPQQEYRIGALTVFS